MTSVKTLDFRILNRSSAPCPADLQTLDAELEIEHAQKG